MPTEINDNEKGYFHVLFITSKPNPSTLKFDHEVKKQIINKETFDRCKDTYKQLGYSNMVIFHNPLVQAQADADAKAQEEAEAKAKAEADANTNSGDEGKLVHEGVEVTTKNVVEFATANNIDVTKGKNLQEKLAIVTIWIEENKK